MRGYAIPIVLLSAVLHAAWNAQMKGSTDRSRFLASMTAAVGLLAGLSIPFVPAPSRAAWACIGLSSALHLFYNFLLLQNYRISNFSTAYPIARGVSPLLITVGALVLMRQRPHIIAVAGVAMISIGILYLAKEQSRMGARATLFALGTGVAIAAYTVTDTIGVQRSGSTLSYVVWIFASYLLMPPGLLLLQNPIRFEKIQDSLRAVGAGALSMTAYFLVLWATHYVDVGIVSALRETSVLWALVIAHFLLGEPFTWKRFCSASAVCVGIVLLIPGLAPGRSPNAKSDESSLRMFHKHPCL